jgi:hypothetical protein
MPVTLRARAIGDALARPQEHDPSAARTAEALEVHLEAGAPQPRAEAI